MDAHREDVPGRILAGARELFAANGYRATSMQRIADRAGVTKAGLYYHFSSKDEILRRLTEPLLDELETTLAAAERHADHETVRWHAVEGYLDVFIRHRETLLMLVRDMSLLVEAPVADRFRSAAALANELVAGPGADFAGRVRAAQAVAGLGDSVVIFSDADPAVLREHVISGVRTLLAPAGPPAPPAGATPGGRGRPRGRRGGRPRALDRAHVERAREMYASGRHTVSDIAEWIGVSRATVYRYLND